MTDTSYTKRKRSSNSELPSRSKREGMPNAQQKKFLDLYLKSCDLKDSYHKAGYQGDWTKAAYSLVKRLQPHIDKAKARQDAIDYKATGKAAVKIVEKINTLMDKPEVELEISARTITKEWILNQLIDNVVQSKIGDPVYTKDGVLVGHKPNFFAANQALQMLGKEMGMFSDGGNNAPDEHRYKDIEELKERVRQRSLKLGLPIPGICQRVEDKDG